MGNNEETTTLASELLTELKRSNFRWFIIALAEFFGIIALVIMLFVVPVEESSTITQHTNGIDNGSTVTQSVADE